MILDFDYVYDKYDLNVSGIIHIGGHYGREIDKYKSHNVNDIVLFEPLTSNFSVLNDIVKNTEGNIIAHQVALGNDNRKVTMNISSNEAQSSSILTPKVHLTAHPEVTFSGTEEVEMRKLDDYDYQDYNMIVVDVQGYELEVLKGASQTLSNIDYIYCEVNCDEVYEDNARVEEIDEFLSSYGFKRVETQWYYTGVWGDSLYIKNKLNNFPTVYYTSLEESIDRQKNITEQFQKYGITPIPIISKRFAQSDDIVTGKYLHQLNNGTKGCCVSHLKAIKQWYDSTEEEYGFFCEDDLSLETVQYWNFTWEEFMKKIPKDSECFQLLTIRANFDTFELRERYWDDWGATAYIIGRDYAKKIIDNYIKGNTYHLEIPNNDIMPLIENILFSSIGKTYTVPLFVENTEFISTYQNSDDDDVNDGQKTNHKIASDFVLNYWKNIKNEQKNGKKMFIMTPNTAEDKIEELITNYSLDTENADNNFALGLWYEKRGHTAPALSYYLRCAERAEDEDLAYEALIRGSYCYEKQGTRDESSRSMIWQAQAFLPHRPEAYFLLSRFAEKREWWQDCYLNADLALRYCRFDCKPLRTDVEYPGKYGLLFEKAVSGYWWGKDKECKEIFLDLIENHSLSDIYKKSVEENLKRVGIDINPIQKIELISKVSDIFNNGNYNTDKGDLGYIENFYDNFFLKFANKTIKFIEIGVYNGGSIKLWRDYLNSESEIYASDINYFEHIEGTYSVIGDMYSDDQVAKFADEHFDLIIDDGPHTFESFVILMQKYFSKLKTGGSLVIEDIINPSWVSPLADLSKSLGYSLCEIVDMTNKQKTPELLDRWKGGLYILNITK